ncbi:MAG: SMP-30/gluconolactonase/LRE family protein [Betaproteobacteria bacterium]|nr:SMP-30/gluconolactonase/LRE family protein [Betaproteobacteria bacterium]
MLRAERVLQSEDELGECPIWDERAGALWWVDIHGRAIKRYDGTNVRIMPMPQMPGSIALRREGGLLVAMENGVFLLGTEEPKLLVRPPEHEDGLRFNDGRCDRAGRFWVGTLAEPDFPPRGVLYRIGADGSAKAFRTGIQVPNSTTWSPNGRTMYFADSPRHKIWAFDYDAERGEISGERVFAAPHPGFPDGSCIDTEGCLWNAEWGARRVVRYTPAGEVDRIVEVAAEKPSCCCFGGTQLDTLYITTAGRAGLFAVTPGVKGLAESRFG